MISTSTLILDQPLINDPVVITMKKDRNLIRKVSCLLWSSNALFTLVKRRLRVQETFLAKWTFKKLFICIIKTNCITIICAPFTIKEEHELFNLQKTYSEYDLFWCYRAGLKFQIWVFKHLVDKTKIKDGCSIRSRQINLSFLSFPYCT